MTEWATFWLYNSVLVELVTHSVLWRWYTQGNTRSNTRSKTRSNANAVYHVWSRSKTTLECCPKSFAKLFGKHCLIQSQASGQVRVWVRLNNFRKLGERASEWEHEWEHRQNGDWLRRIKSVKIVKDTFERYYQTATLACNLQKNTCAFLFL